MTESFLKKMGYPLDGPWIAVRHRDTDHDHVHIAMLRSVGGGRVWDQTWSARRAIAATEELEIEFDLHRHSRDPPPKRRPTRAEIEIARRKAKFSHHSKTEEIPVTTREKIQNAIDSVLKKYEGQQIELDQLVSELKAQGIETRPYAPKGAWAGISFECDGIAFAGSKLGTQYTSNGLMARGVMYKAPTPVAADKPEPAAPAVSAEAVAPAKDGQDELPAKAADFLPALPEITREEYEQPDIHILLKILKEIGEIAARMAERIAALLRRFVNMILRQCEASFGLPDGRLGTLQDPPPRERPGLPAPGARANEDQAIAQAVQQLSQVVDAVKNDDPSLLPDVEGKDQLIKDLEWEHGNSRPGPQWPDAEDQPRGTTAERLAWFSQRAAAAQQRHSDLVGKRELRAFNLPRFAPSRQEADRRVRRALLSNKNHPTSRALAAWRDAERRLKALRAKPVPAGLLNAVARRRHEQELATLVREEKEAKAVLDGLEAEFITPESLAHEEARILAEPERVAAAQELAAIDAEIRSAADAAAAAQADLVQAQTAARFEESLAKSQPAPVPTERNAAGLTPSAERPRQ